MCDADTTCHVDNDTTQGMANSEATHDLFGEWHLPMVPRTCTWVPAVSTVTHIFNTCVGPTATAARCHPAWYLQKPGLHRFVRQPGCLFTFCCHTTHVACLSASRRLEEKISCVVAVQLAATSSLKTSQDGAYHVCKLYSLLAELARLPAIPAYYAGFPGRVCKPTPVGVNSDNWRAGCPAWEV